jgi:hypothetical protein
MKQFKEFEEAYGRHDAYTRDYHSSVSGMGKHQSHAYRADGGGNDERHDLDTHHKPADHPHSVHINGKKWKTFGSQSHASNVAKKIKGATVHKEEVELCAVCKKNPCECDDSHGFVKEGADAHYAEAEAHKNKASKALETSDMAAHHHHMSNHHEAMGRWHEEKGRHSSADREYAKAEEHHEKSLKPDHSRTVKEDTISELSTELLARYKKKAGEAASAADKKGDYATGNKRFKGINKATNKQFDNDLKKESMKSPGVGWMLKKDPKLGAIIKARKEKYKSFKQHVGKKIEDNKDTK